MLPKTAPETVLVHDVARELIQALRLEGEEEETAQRGGATIRRRIEGMDWQVTVIESDVANAFVVPNGAIFVYTVFKAVVHVVVWHPRLLKVHGMGRWFKKHALKTQTHTHACRACWSSWGRGARSPSCWATRSPTRSPDTRWKSCRPCASEAWSWRLWEASWARTPTAGCSTSSSPSSRASCSTCPSGMVVGSVCSLFFSHSFDPTSLACMYASLPACPPSWLVTCVSP